MLEDHEVREAGAPLNAGGGCHRTAGIVRRDIQAIEFRHRGDFSALEQSAAMLYIRHDDIYGVIAAERSETFHSKQDFTPGHWLADGRVNLHCLFGSLRRDWLFIPGELLRFQAA